MKALIIIASILILLLVLLFSRLRLSLVFEGRLGLRLSYLFLRFRLYPRKAKKSKKKKKEKQKNTAHKRGKTPKKSTGEAPADEKKTKKKQPLTFADVRFLLRILRELIAKILDHASRHVRIHVRTLRITVGGERDAARAAIEYGLITQGISYLLAALDDTGLLKEGNVHDVGVDVNYLEKDHALTARIDIACPLLFLIGFALRSLSAALSTKSRWTRHRARKKKAKNTMSSEKEISNG